MPFYRFSEIFRTNPAKRVATVFLAALVPCLLWSCAGDGPEIPATAHQTAPGRVAVIALPQVPHLAFEGFAHSRDEGVKHGAGSVFASCASALGSGSCGGEFCGAVVIVWLGVCGVAGAVGGVVGAISAPADAQLLAVDTELVPAAQVHAIQNSFRERLQAASLAGGTQLVVIDPEARATVARDREYHSLSPGVNSVLEVAIMEAGTTGSGINAPVQIYLKARARLVRAGDNAELFASEYTYRGPSLKLAQWTENHGRRLLDALDRGYEVLARHIYDAVFHLYPFPDRRGHGAGLLAFCYGLAPLYPETRGQVIDDSWMSKRFGWTRVDSLQPVLRWSSFPRPGDIEQAPQEMRRVTDVRYDLLIARERNGAPAGEVYRREGLAGAEHRLEQPLQPDTRYLWTVRARFSLDGRERVTEWGSTHYPGGEKITAPSQFSYRFRTP